MLGFDSEQEMLSHFAKDTSNMIACGIVFQRLDSNKIDVKLRFSFAPQNSGGFSLFNINSFTWLTARLYPMFQEAGPRSSDLPEGGPPSYYKEGFLYVQHHLSKSIAIHLNSNTANLFESIQLNVQRFPYPAYIADQFLFSLSFLFPLVLILSFIFSSVNLTTSIVLEKEKRLREMMKMMGLQEWQHWTSCFLNSLAPALVSIAVMVILLCVPLTDGQAILAKSNPLAVLLFFVLYIVSSIAFCFLLSTLFFKANFASIVSGAVYFVSILPYFQVFMNYR